MVKEFVRLRSTVIYACPECGEVVKYCRYCGGFLDNNEVVVCDTDGYNHYHSRCGK